VKITPPPSQESSSIGSKYSHSGKHKVEEASKISEVLKHKLEASLLGHIIPQEKGSAQTVPKTRTNGASFVANHPCWYLKYNRATTIYRDWYSHYIIDTSTIHS
jgi:hypothetical protein